MKFNTLFVTCLKALVRNPMRAALTVLGIVIGIAAVVAIMEIGEGSKKQVADKFSSMGTNVVTIYGASTSTAGVNTGMGGRASLYAVDADALVKECPEYVKAASPVVRASGQIIVGNQNWSPRSIMGGNEQYMSIEGWKVATGSAFTRKQVDEASRVCLIGSTIAKELYADTDPIGKDIRVKDVVFTVIGVLETKGADGMGNDQDDCLILPWTSIRTRLMGSSGSAVISKGGAASATKVSSTDVFPTTSVSFYPGSDLQPYTNGKWGGEWNWAKWFGMNSIAVYVISHVLNFNSISTSLLHGLEHLTGVMYPFIIDLANSLILILIMRYMHKHRMFLKV